MLKDAKILIMDEATASVDMVDSTIDAPTTARLLLARVVMLTRVVSSVLCAVLQETDSLIQLSLRTYFQSCTILTIAHRLATIMDYDQVLVLDFGAIKEFDTPANLLRKDAADTEANIFAGLVNETGPQTSELLKNLAFEAEKVNAKRHAGDGSPSAAAALLHLERAVWTNPSVMGESSVSRRTPRFVITDASRLLPTDVLDPSADDDLDDPSMVEWHEHRNDEEADLQSVEDEDEEERKQQMADTNNVHVQIN
jgi:ABC-type multidrug transport system ATPase subunit